MNEEVMTKEKSTRIKKHLQEMNSEGV